MTISRFHSPQGAVKFLRERGIAITRRTLDRWFQLRKGPARIKLGSKVFYREAALISYLERLEQDPAEAFRR